MTTSNAAAGDGETGAMGDIVGYDDRAEYYAVEYREDVDHGFLQGMVREAGGAVLEMPCGAGRNLDCLAAVANRVVGIDLEPAMLTAARRRLAAGPDAGTVVLHAGDMRTLELDETFDLVIVPREAIQLLDDDADVRATLATGARHLRRGGRMVVDLAMIGTPGPHAAGLTPDYYDPDVPDGVCVAEWTRSLGGRQWLTRWRVQQHDAVGGVRITFHYRRSSGERAGAAEPVASWSSEIRLQNHDVEKVAGFARANHLSPLAVYGDYTGRPHRAGQIRAVLDLQKTDDA